MTNSTPNGGMDLRSSTPCTEICTSIDYVTGLWNKIHDFFNYNNFCDVTLVAKDNIFKINAHKVILCAASEYFLAMFGGCMREAGEKEVQLQIDGPTLKSTINYIYTASIELTTENVEEILITANLLELAPLKTLCCEFIIKQLDPSNCLGIALFAEQYCLEDLYKPSEAFLCDNFEKISKDEEFFKLDAYQLCKFLSRNDLRVNSEEDVYLSLMSWIDHDTSKREDFMSKLLHHVRFPLLTPKFVGSVIEPNCKNVECEKLVYKTYKWQLLPECHLYTKEQTQLRNYNNLVMAISGWGENGGTLNIGLHFPTSNEWIYKAGISALAIGRKEFGSTAFKGKLIIAGGVLTTTAKLTDQVDCLDLRTFEWTSLAPLNTKRKLFKMASVNGCLYAVGGTGDGGGILSTVEKYDPSTQQWKYVTSMSGANNYNRTYKLHVSTAFNKLCVSKENIQSNNSYSQTSNYSYYHNLYDPETDIWTDGWLVTNHSLIGSFFRNDWFMAVSKNEITQYNYVTKSPTILPTNGSLRTECTNCDIFGDRIIAYGNDIFQEYDFSSNRWKILPLLQNTQGEVILVSNR